MSMFQFLARLGFFVLSVAFLVFLMMLLLR